MIISEWVVEIYVTIDVWKRVSVHFFLLQKQKELHWICFSSILKFSSYVTAEGVRLEGTYQTSSTGKHDCFSKLGKKINCGEHERSQIKCQMGFWTRELHRSEWRNKQSFGRSVSQYLFLSVAINSFQGDDHWVGATPQRQDLVLCCACAIEQSKSVLVLAVL